ARGAARHAPPRGQKASTIRALDPERARGGQSQPGQIRGAWRQFDQGAAYVEAGSRARRFERTAECNHDDCPIGAVRECRGERRLTSRTWTTASHSAAWPLGAPFGRGAPLARSLTYAGGHRGQSREDSTRSLEEG